MDSFAKEVEDIWKHIESLDYDTIEEFLRLHSQYCLDVECDLVAIFSCPFGRTEHFWKDGCPACFDKPDAKISKDHYHPFREKS